MSKNPYEGKPLKVDADKWVSESMKQYDRDVEQEEKVRLSITIPRSHHEEIIGILPSLYGQKLGKHNRPRKPTITDYITRLIADDLERRRIKN